MPRARIRVRSNNMTTRRKPRKPRFQRYGIKGGVRKDGRPFPYAAGSALTWEAAVTDPPCGEAVGRGAAREARGGGTATRSEEHTSELQSLMRISYAVFCLHTKQKIKKH